MHPKMCAPTASKSSSLLPRPNPDYPCAWRTGIAFYPLRFGGKTSRSRNERNRDWIFFNSWILILILSFVEMKKIGRFFEQSKSNEILLN